MIFDSAKRCEKSMLVSTIITLVLGIVLIFKPGESLKIITGIIACFFLLIGIVQFVDYFKQNKMEKMTSYSLILGIILCGIGIFLFINIDSLVNFITTIIGLSLIVKSLFKLQFAFNIKDISNKWFYNLIIGLLGMALGILLIFNPFKSAEMFLRIVGGLLVIGSIIEIVETNMVIKTIDDAKELPFEEKKPKKEEMEEK